MKKLLLVSLCLPLLFCCGDKNCISGDCENGYGTYTWPGSDDTYVGEWKDGKKHGQGTLDGGKENWKYVGEWEDGEKHGHGKLEDEWGTYIGKWKEGRKHGKGIYTSANGEIEKGLWIDGDFIGEIK